MKYIYYTPYEVHLLYPTLPQGVSSASEVWFVLASILAGSQAPYPAAALWHALLSSPASPARCILTVALLTVALLTVALLTVAGVPQSLEACLATVYRVICAESNATPLETPVATTYTTCCSLLAACCLLLTTHCLQYCLLLTTYCLLPTTYYPLPTTYHLLPLPTTYQVTPSPSRSPWPR